MIVFDLRCAPVGHVFEAWFGSSADYDAQKARGLVACPLCGSEEIDKAPMAPRVPRKGNMEEAPAPLSAEAAKAMLAAMAAAQHKMLAESEPVGERFVDEARAIHLGEAEARAIHGRASRRDAEELLEEGIEIMPLPFPFAEPGEEN